MHRRVLGAGATVPAFLALLALAAAPRAESQCTEVRDKEFTIAVGDEAVATPECVSVKTGRTTLYWQAGPNVKTLTVAFKAPSLCPGADQTAPPEDPKCVGGRCTLDKAKQKTKGAFCYSVVVVRKDGTPKTVDPRLIINP